jgi:uncharacterized membrane protein YcaP (DUF421 family)
MNLFDLNWHDMFSFTVSPLELFIRGTAIYLALFLMLRFLLKREAGSMGLTDLLLLVLLADAAQNAMAGEYKSILDGLILVGTIVAWNYTLNLLAFKYPYFRRLVLPDKLQLVRNGKLLRQNLRRERITVEELMSEIRTAGCEDLSGVKAAYIEPDGMISVITFDHAGHKKEDRKAV